MLIGPEQQRDNLLKRLLTPDVSGFLFCFAPLILLRNAGKRQDDGGEDRRRCFSTIMEPKSCSAGEQNTNTHKSLQADSSQLQLNELSGFPGDSQVVEVVSAPAPGCSPSTRSFLLIMSQTVLKYKRLLKRDILVLIPVLLGYSLRNTLKENASFFMKPWRLFISFLVWSQCV